MANKSSGKFITVTPPAHVCDPPDAWIAGKDRGSPRLKYGVGTVWECECGQRWVIPLARIRGTWERIRS